MKRMAILLLMVILLCGCERDESRFTGAMPQQITQDDLRENLVRFANVIDGYPSDLEGEFVNFKVKNTDDAFRAVASVAEVLGIQNFQEEIRFYNYSEGRLHDIYSFSQYYQGIPVIGNSIILQVDPETKHVQYLMSGYVPDISISTDPEVSEEEAISAVQEEYQVNVTDKSQLVIWLDGSKREPCLAWHLETDSEAPYEVWLNAQSGEILYAEYPEDYFGGA